jgi:hypothetical protein
MPFRGDSNTHTTETPRPRAHIKAEVSRLDNNFWCFVEPVNCTGTGPNFYFVPSLMRPLLTGVKMAGFTNRPGFEIKTFQKIYFPQNFTPYFIFYPAFSLQNPAVPGCRHPDFGTISAAAPAFTGYFSLEIFL